MAATDVRILAPIPGRSAIGVEVPNHTRQLVSLGDIMASPEAKTATHPLEVAIGKDIAGRAVFLNLATTPHLLIAGTTGAGKSSGLNCIITSHPDAQHARPGAADPHRPQAGRDGPVQPAAASAHPAGHQPQEGGQRAGWAVKEMERRYDLLFEVGFRDITGYNAAYDRGELSPSRAPSGAVRAAAVHRRRRRRAQRPDDGGRPRRRGVASPASPRRPVPSAST